MSKAFWAQHSIKGGQQPQQPATPASMTAALRRTRKDVSDMSVPELQVRMNNEATLRSRIRAVEGLPAVKPTSADYARHLAEQGQFALVDTRTPADNTRVVRREK
jgi:hypothetical protein